jgi:hypothetical protein
MKWLKIESLSLDNVTELEDLHDSCPSTAAGIELVRFAPLGRQNGFCIHESPDDSDDHKDQTDSVDVIKEKEAETQALVTSV